MKRFQRAILFSILTFTLSFQLSFNPVSAGAAEPKLAGARPVIQAINYASIQDAIDAVPAEGGIVMLPPGKFEIDKPLVITSGDTMLVGAGGATHIHNTNEEGLDAIQIHPPADAKLPDGKKDPKPRIWRVQLQNFRVTGNEKSGRGINAKWVQEIFIHGVTCSYHGSDGIFLDFCFEDPRISDCLLTYNKAIGLNLVGCHDIVVSANHFEENQDALRCDDGFNLCMSGNNLDDHLRHGVIIENTYGSIVSANMIEECQGSAIILDRECYGVTMAANVIAHNGKGIILKDAHGCAVSANTFTLLAEDALWIGPQSGRITVTGNNFSNSYIGGGKVKRRTDDLKAAGLTLDKTRGVTVSGNVFASVRPKAVEVIEPTTHVIFGNNLLIDVESDHKLLKDSIIEHILEAAAEPVKADSK
ncbi:Pectate lyase superfamily protein [Gimesia panareensis]|uniref:Pectate lyase superfamily protein n=1 Tax=Gimesia panareensis TaxID=2527978 RepID=A0A518FM73_9PLAN|nr:right-handed parallel beta-helix repeat-containing protein [Gimesia panareensis]QDV17453.1 Pectate lyase superfamily protein [Gimesia panareensis]